MFDVLNEVTRKIQATKKAAAPRPIVGFAGGSAGMAGYPAISPVSSASPSFGGFALSSVLLINYSKNTSRTVSYASFRALKRDAPTQDMVTYPGLRSGI